MVRMKIIIDNVKKSLVDEWVNGWVDGWMGVKAVLRIAYTKHYAQ